MSRRDCRDVVWLYNEEGRITPVRCVLISCRLLAGAKSNRGNCQEAT
jgi:hypothetical protein